MFLVALVAAFTGAVASVSAIGIGSILTPVVAWKYDIKTAVAAVAIPHAAAMLLRFLRLRRELDVSVLLSFGLMNVGGALLGALLQSAANTHVLAAILGGILLLVGIAGGSGWVEHLQLSRPAALGIGAVAGGFGGLVGSQGPMRSAAMLGLKIRKEAYVATATAIGLSVDAVRLPVYFIEHGPKLLAIWPVIALATVAVLAGTLAGERVLRRIPEALFRRTVAVIIGLVGALLLYRSVLA